jgi:hypothetical protein
VPSFRIGIHGGDVVISEQGETKRSIGIYGDTINIAARMEEAAKTHNVDCILSKTIADAIGGCDRIRPIGEEAVKGISTPIGICEYGPAIANAGTVKLRRSSQNTGGPDCRHAALVALRHCATASDRKIRSVDRETRWRWRLKVLWTAA